MAADKKDVSNIAVVYARYSSSGQREESIDGQLAAARKYAQQKGYTIIHEYIDRAKTGKNDNREDFQRMLSDTSKKAFSIIIVWKVDRFGRNREEVTFNKYRCKKNGVHVEYVAEHVPEGPEGVLLESLLEGMAEYFTLQLSQNVKRGLRENAKQHKAISGRPPLGYKLTADKHFEIDPETAPLVKLIFEKYAQGETLFTLVNYLNEQGYRTSRGGLFQKTSLDKTLRNEKYIGTYIYQDIHDEDAIPAIIDKETFYRVQERLNTNKRRSFNRKDNYAVYLLTGKLFCGSCGAPMVGKAGHGKKGTKYNYYVCRNRKDKTANADGSICEKRAIRQDLIEPFIVDAVMDLLWNDDLLEFIVDKTWDVYQKEYNHPSEQEALEKELEATERKISNLIKSVEDGMPFASVKVRMDELAATKADLERSIAELGLSPSLKLTRDHILYFLLRFRDMDTNNTDCIKRMIETFVSGIYLNDDTIKIAYNYTGGECNIIPLEDIEKCEHRESVRICPAKRALEDSNPRPSGP